MRLVQTWEIRILHGFYLQRKLTQEIKAKGSLKNQYHVCLVLIPRAPELKMVPRFLITLLHGIQKTELETVTETGILRNTVPLHIYRARVNLKSIS